MHGGQRSRSGRRPRSPSREGTPPTLSRASRCGPRYCCETGANGGARGERASKSVHAMSTRRETASGTPDRASAGEVATDLLIEAGAVLASSLDVAATMQQVAELAVPNLADLCVIDRREEDGSITGVAVAASPELARELEDLRQRFPLDPGGAHPVARVIRSG